MVNNIIYNKIYYEKSKIIIYIYIIKSFKIFIYIYIYNLIISVSYWCDPENRFYFGAKFNSDRVSCIFDAVSVENYIENLKIAKRSSFQTFEPLFWNKWKTKKHIVKGGHELTWRRIRKYFRNSHRLVGSVDCMQWCIGK